MQNNKNIYYVGDVGLPGTAKAIHAQNMARLFSLIGYHVTFFCECWDSKNIFSSDEEFNYLYVKQYMKLPKLSAIEWVWESLTGYKLLRLVLKKIEEDKPDLVVLYGFEGERKLIKKCRKKNIPIILERTDWFEKEDRSSFLDRYLVYGKSEKCMKSLDMKADGIIAISEYLANYYMSNNQTVVCIPPIFPFEKTREISRETDSNQLRLVYAGSLGGQKDQILPVLDVLREINSENIKIYLDIVGVTQEEIERATRLNEWSKYGVKIYGRLSNEETKKIVSKADYSLLLRQNKRYAKAGFSTKFAESMSLGVPVICTKVGGADVIIKDMVDGVHLNDISYDTIKMKLYELLSKSDEEILSMKKNAFRTACICFSVEEYQDVMRIFIDSCKLKKG